MITTKPIANGQYIMVFYWSSADTDCKGLFVGIYHREVKHIDILRSLYA